MPQHPVIDELRRRIASDEPSARIRADIGSLILERIEAADPLTDHAKSALVSAIAALDTASRRKPLEPNRSRLSMALLHVQLAVADRDPRGDDPAPDELLAALSREMLREAARKITS